MPGTKIPEEQRRLQILEAAFQVASQQGLDQLTVRSVALQAGVSSGLVLFHFQRMEMLQLALLEWLVERVLVLKLPDTPVVAEAGHWLLGVVQQQLAECHSQRQEIELFVVYWLLAHRQPNIRLRIQAALQRYRADLRVAVEVWYAQTQPSAPEHHPEALTLLLSTLIEGYALQVIHDPSAAQPEQLLATLHPLLIPNPVATTPPDSPTSAV